MGLFDFLRGKPDEKTPEQIEQERIRAQKTTEFNRLILKFEFHNLETLCEDVLGMKPPQRFEIDPETKERIDLPLNRFDYEEFIRSGVFSLQQIKNYALKHNIVPKSFFDEESKSEEQKNDFESICNSIKSQFEPEKIDDEEHLEAQLMIFLKAKFPTRKISRQVEISENERLDILIDDKYAFELKVPTQRNALRDLGAQLEEYSQKYPRICAIIFDDISKNLTDDIDEYVDKYKRNYQIQSIVLRGEKRVNKSNTSANDSE